MSTRNRQPKVPQLGGRELQMDHVINRTLAHNRNIRHSRTPVIMTETHKEDTTSQMNNRCEFFMTNQRWGQPYTSLKSGLAGPVLRSPLIRDRTQLGPVSLSTYEKRVLRQDLSSLVLPKSELGSRLADADKYINSLHRTSQKMQHPYNFPGKTSSYSIYCFKKA